MLSDADAESCRAPFNKVYGLFELELIVFACVLLVLSAARLDPGAPPLRPANWRSGEQTHLVKVVAPFGGVEEFARASAPTWRTIK